MQYSLYLLATRFGADGFGEPDGRRRLQRPAKRLGRWRRSCQSPPPPARRPEKGLESWASLRSVCGLTFDPSVSEEAERYGKLTVLPTKMNPDLSMGDKLPKKTGTGNLFMVFGEPDVEIRNAGPPKKGGKKNRRKAQRPAGDAPADDQFVVEIKGLDVYDPTTGQIRSNLTDDIACWFIDTDYDGESFFVRHAYFTGAEEPYEKLKRALRADIDEALWSSLNSTVSRPFPRPASGKIAVKVINHYGDEVLKVYTP